jgi:transposase
MTERAVEIVPELIRGHGRDGRCKYDPAAKAELVRRCLQPGVSVAAMALAHGVNANLVRRWIMLALRDR